MSINEISDTGTPEYTGRLLVVGQPHQGKEMLSAMKSSAGLNLASSRDFEDQAVGMESMGDGDGIYLDEIGVAIVTPDDEGQIAKIAALDMLHAADSDQPVVEPERIVHTMQEGFGDYMRGYRDAVNSVADAYTGRRPGEDTPPQEEMEALAAGSTWGLQATRTVVGFPFLQNWNGTGIKICVLDTGMDLAHPDFAGRSIVSRSFVPNEAVQDLNGHGTHCVGTACGPKQPKNPTIPRYGVAFGSSIFVGKVLSNGGSGADGWILAGINWAIAHRCHVISMSLGALATNSGYSQAYENAARAALNVGSLIVAAAGNNHGAPVSHPANCPSIMAVGAVDQNRVKAGFSNVTHFPPHGKVDLVGPGVGVLSSLPVSRGTHGSLSGTSMATPHVAGIAGLFAQQNSALRGAALWQRLTTSTLPLPSQPSSHVGAGLVQAPFARIRLEPIPFPKPWPPLVLPLPRGSDTEKAKSTKSRKKLSPA